MRTLRIYFLLATIVLFAGCSKDEAQLPTSELILGQWKIYNFSLKVVTTEGETTNIINEYLASNAFMKFEDADPDIVYNTFDGVNIEQDPWTIDVNQKILTISDSEYQILRLDKDYLIIRHLEIDQLNNDKYYYAFILTR